MPFATWFVYGEHPFSGQLQADRGKAPRPFAVSLRAHRAGRSSWRSGAGTKHNGLQWLNTCKPLICLVAGALSQKALQTA
jgi:hypothetical protein